MPAPAGSVTLRTSFALLLAVLIVLILLAGRAAGIPASYSLSYSVGAISEVPSAIDIVDVSTSGPFDGNLTGTFQVTGVINLTTPQVMYAVYFDGTSSTGAVAWITYTDDLHDGTLYNSSIIPPINEPVSLNGDASTMTFTLPVADVGPASSFAVNVYAIDDGIGISTTSWLGTNYPSGQDQVCNDTTLQCMLIASGSGGSGSGGNGSPSASSASATSSAWLYAVIAVVVVAVLALLAVMVRRRGRAGRPPAGPGARPSLTPPPPPPGR